MNEIFNKAYRGSYYTIVGCGGDINEWKEGYANMLRQAGIYDGTIPWVEFSSKDYNETFNLHGNNRYPDDLNCLAFPLDGMNVGKLSMFKLRMQDRWFDDMVDNDLRREGTTFDMIA